MPEGSSFRSMRHLILRSKNDSSHGRVLTADEERIFADLVCEAKKKEALSWCEHKTFDTVTPDKACIKPQGSRWHLTWRTKIHSVGKTEWEVKGRIVAQGFGDAQGHSVITRSPTAARTAQRKVAQYSHRSREHQ